MSKQFFLIIGFVFGSLLISKAQNDPILFTVGKYPVNLSEFKYIYEKSNGKDADYSTKSLEKYLDLYTKFKLKIAKAREMELDTSPVLRNELAGYRRKLANSYLMDKEVSEKLTREIYNRMKSDVRISHLLLQVKNLRSPADTMPVYKKIVEIKKRLDKGVPFEELVKIYSQDVSSRESGGDLGYMTALFPKGYNELEDAAYSLSVGKTSGILRSISGYHIIKVTDKRPARGEVEFAQILISKDPKISDKKARAKAEEILGKIRKGDILFKDAANAFSEDKATGAKGGYVGFVTINTYEQAFEDAIFALEKEGDISGVVESSVGFHILKRLRKKEVRSYKKEKRGILAKLRNDPRYAVAIQAFIEKTKKNVGFKERKESYNKWVALLPDSTFFTHKWKPAGIDNTLLFVIGDEKVTLGDLDDYVYKAGRKRFRFGRNAKIAKAAKELYMDFVNERVMRYAESKLEDNYPEFKALMREYEEGILLFDISQKEVWNKAAEDSTGLAKFYPSIQNKSQFQWQERASVVTYEFSAATSAKVKAKIRKYAGKKTPAKVLAKFNKKARVVSMNRETYELSKAPKNIKGLWKAKAMTPMVTNKDKISFSVIEKIIPSTPKKLEEARGYAISQYQDYLEKEWVKNLQKQYKVTINQKVLDSITK